MACARRQAVASAAVLQAAGPARGVQCPGRSPSSARAWKLGADRRTQPSVVSPGVRTPTQGYGARRAANVRAPRPKKGGRSPSWGCGGRRPAHRTPQRRRPRLGPQFPELRAEHGGIDLDRQGDLQTGGVWLTVQVRCHLIGAPHPSRSRSSGEQPGCRQARVSVWSAHTATLRRPTAV